MEGHDGFLVNNPPKETVILYNPWLGGVFKHFYVYPLPGEMIQFDKYFSRSVETTN